MDVIEVIDHFIPHILLVSCERISSRPAPGRSGGLAVLCRVTQTCKTPGCQVARSQ